MTEHEAAVSDFDVSAYTDDAGMVHVRVVQGDRVFELHGAAQATIAEKVGVLGDPVDPLLQLLGLSRFRFTLEIADVRDLTVRLVPAPEPESEQQLHARFACPGWEYATTEGPRKQWDTQDQPPCDENGDPDPSWERNVDAGRDGWERFDYTEEAHWRRRVVRPDGVLVMTEHEAHCGPSRGGFRVCYCRCERCRDDAGCCVCPGCRVLPGCRGQEERDG